MSVDPLKDLIEKKDDPTIPPPGTPPTWDKTDGSIIDPGNPWIGPVNSKVGYPTEGYSGLQLRRIRRAQDRREAAERRVGQRDYDRRTESGQKYRAAQQLRLRTLTGQNPVTPALLQNIGRDQLRRAKNGTPEEFLVKQQNRRDDLDEAAAGRLADRREKRFRAGKPRGKDLREVTFNEYESLQPPVARP